MAPGRSSINPDALRGDGIQNKTADSPVSADDRSDTGEEGIATF